MVDQATLAQITKLDLSAMEDFGLDILQMMEEAGSRFAVFVKNYLGNLKNKKIMVLSGTGNNGGDGLTSARYLANWGANIQVVLAKGDLKQAPAHQLEILKKMGLPVETNPDSLPDSDLIVDALLGYNQVDDPKYPYDDLIDMANQTQVPIIAFDKPSGLNIESGEPGMPTIKAKVTITLAIIKTGLTKDVALPYVGYLHLVDIGIPRRAYEVSGLNYPFGQDSPNIII